LKDIGDIKNLILDFILDRLASIKIMPEQIFSEESCAIIEI